MATVGTEKMDKRDTSELKTLIPMMSKMFSQRIEKMHKLIITKDGVNLRYARAKCLMHKEWL